MQKVITLFFSLTLAFSLCGQKSGEQISRTFSSGQKYVIVANISGNIEVEGYSGSQIKLEVQKEITGDSDAEVAEGKEEVQLGVIERGDTLMLYMDSPCQNFGYRNKSRKNWNQEGWGYNWNENCHWDPDYEYQLDFKLQIPQSAGVQVSTINNGNVIVRNVQGGIRANNVNGSITLEDISNTTYANTVNGDVTLRYTRQPAGDNHYYTLNGDINAYYPKGLSAEMAFKTFNGEFFTNLPEVELLPGSVKKEELSNKEGIAYKLEGKTLMKVRDGRAKLDFETFNGDVYVRELD